MGVSKRGPSRAVIAESVLRPMPRTLTTAEVGGPVTEATAPIPVIAWVPFPTVSVELDCEAVAWSPRAVRVRFQLRDLQSRDCWVWASAVRRVQT